MRDTRLTREVTSEELQSIPSYLWKGKDNNIQIKPRLNIPTSARRQTLQTVLYAGINTDFRTSEEFLANMGELPENFHPDYKL